MVRPDAPIPRMRPFGGVVVLLGLSGCSAPSDPASPAEIVIFHAGSLSIPLREISELFRSRHPDVIVKAEAAGSRDTARKVSDLERPCDVLAVADYQVIDSMLVPEHASFNVHFATNELGIAYTARSATASQITAENWPEILGRPDVNLGRADPNSDPCGYRTLIALQLAEKHLSRPGLAATLEAKHGQRYVRPKETDLLALLEAGEVDYIFIYRSVAAQHGLDFLRLPDEVNLGAVKHADLYGSAVVQISGRKPGVTVAQRGSPIAYSVTIPSNAQNRDLAVEYLELLLSAEGQAVMQRNGQSPIVPALAGGYDALPERLKTYCKPLKKP